MGLETNACWPRIRSWQVFEGFDASGDRCAFVYTGLVDFLTNRVLIGILDVSLID